MTVRQIIVRGRVVDVQHREPVEGVIVEFVAYVAGGRVQPVGTARTLGTGFFVVRVAAVSADLRAEHFGVRVFDANGAGLDVAGGDPRWPAGQTPETLELLVDAPVAQEYDCSDGPTLRRGYTAVSEGQGWSNTLRVGGGSYTGGVAAIVGTITGSDGRPLPNVRVRLTFRGLGTTYTRPTGHPGINTTYETDPVRVFELARTYTHAPVDDDAGTYRLVYPTELTSVASDWRGQGWATSGDGWDDVRTEAPHIVVLHVEAPLNGGVVDLGQTPNFDGPYQEVDRRVLFLGSLETDSVQIHDFMVGSLALEEDTEFHRLDQLYSSLLSRYYDARSRTVNTAFGPADVEALALAYDEDPRAVALYFLTHKLADEIAVHANRSRNVLTTAESMSTTQGVLSHERCYGMVRAGVPSGSAAFLATPLVDCKCALETSALDGTIRAQSSGDVDTVGDYLLHAGVGHNYTHGTGSSIASPVFRENSVGAVLNAGSGPAVGTPPSGIGTAAEAKALAIHRALYVFEQHRRGDHSPRPGADVDLWSTDATDPAWDSGTPSNNSVWNLVRNGKDWEGNDIDTHGDFGDEAPFFDYLGTNAVLGDYADGVSGVVAGFRSSSWAPVDVALAPLGAIEVLAAGHLLPATYSTVTKYATAVKERAAAGQWNAAFLNRLASDSDSDVQDYVTDELGGQNLRRLRPSWADVSAYGTISDADRRTLLRNLRQRLALAKLGGRGEEAAVLDALSGVGITSARQIATAPKSLISAIPGLDADAVHARAVHQTMAALTLYVDRHPNSNNLGADPDRSVLGFDPPSAADWDLHEVDHAGDVTDSDRHGYVHYPEWRTVFSPLAYLADLLRWVDARGGWSNSGGLQDRRPDLEHIHLSEENTFQTVRYLDLVLEVLEVAAATLYDSSYAPFGGLLKTMNGDADGPSTYLFERAYTDGSGPALHTDTWPLQAPFDLPGTRLHRFLPLAGVARWQVMDAVYDVGSASTALPNVHGSVLNVPAAFVTELGATPSADWFNNITPTDVDVVAVFMDHFGLTLDETRQLTRMQALHPTNGSQRAITVNAPFSFQNLVFDGPAWDASALHAVSRILRLRIATGWDFHTLDVALRADWAGTPFGSTIIPDQTSLKHVAGLHLLAERTGLEVATLAAWYADLDTYGDGGDDRSAYEHAFLVDLPRLELRGDTNTAPTDPLQVSSDGTDVLASVASDSFADVGTGVRTALGLSEAEYAAAMAWMNSQETSPVGDPLTLDVTLRRLSRLHRIVGLAAAIGTSVDTTTRLAVSWRADGDVFADSWETLDFLSGVAALREAGLSPTQALWVVENPDWTRAEQDPGVPDLQTITEHLGRLRQGIRAQFREILTRSVPEGAEADWGDSWEASLQALVASLITSAQLAAIVEGVVSNQTVGDWTTDLTPVQDALGGAATFDASQIASDLAGIPAVDVTVRGLALNTALRHALTHLRSYELVREALQQAFPGTALARSYADLAPGGTTLMADILTVADLGTVTLTDAVPDTPWADVDEGSAPSAFAAWRYAVRVDLLVRATGWTADDLTWFAARSGNADLLSPLDLPTTGAPSVLNSLLANLRWSAAESALTQRGVVSGLPRLRDIWDDVAAASSDAEARAAMAQAFGTRLGVGPTEVTALMSAQGYASATQSDLLGLSVFERIVDGGILMARLGVSAAALAAIGSATPTFDDAQAGIDAARAAFPSADGWRHAAGPIWQQLKEVRRSVLVAKLRHAPTIALTEDALIGEYLIDVSMTACGRTSRIKQAISTTQQYIQRWLLGLEAAPPLTDSDRRDWQWMKSYRVWEAARRVFLYPENWLDAEFRTGTHLFEKLKQELAGDSLTRDSAARAYEHYLEGLHEIGHLQAVSIYDETLAGLSGSDTDLHVVAKTRQDPSAYYYRRRTDGKWTAWEPVEVGLEGEHVYLVRHMGRVLLIWAAFEKASERMGSGQHAWEKHRTAVRWHWSTRNSEAWTKPQTTVKRLYVADYDEIPPEDTGRLQFRVQQFLDGDNIEHLAIWYMGSGRKRSGNRGGRGIMADDTYSPDRPVVWDVVADGLVVRNYDDPLVVAARAALPDKIAHRQLLQHHRVSSANRLLRQQYVVHGNKLEDGSLAVGTHRGFQLFRTGADFVVPHQGWNFAFRRPFIVDAQTRQYLIEAPRARSAGPACDAVRPPHDRLDARFRSTSRAGTDAARLAGVHAHRPSAPPVPG